MTPVGNPETGSILVKITGDIKSEPAPSKTQDQITSGDHVTFSGTATCDDCSESLLVRVMPFVNPEEAGSGTPPGPITTKKLSSVGSYDVAVPKGSSAVVVELLADGNNDGKPSAGERLAVLEKAGSLTPQKDESGLDLNATDQASTFGDTTGTIAPNQPDQSGGGAFNTPVDAGESGANAASAVNPGNTGDNIGPPGDPPEGGNSGPPGAPPSQGAAGAAGAAGAGGNQAGGSPPPSGGGGVNGPPDGGGASPSTNGPADAPGDGTNIGPPGPPPDGGGNP